MLSPCGNTDSRGLDTANLQIAKLATHQQHYFRSTLAPLKTSCWLTTSRAIQ